MPELFIIDVIKRFGSVIHRWGNRYLVLAEDITAASETVPDIVAGEKAFHSQYVNFERARVSSAVANDTLYENVYLSGTGDIVPVNLALPAITTMNVIVPVSGFGRPSRKFYHLFVDASYMSTTNDQEWLGSLVGTCGEAMVTMQGSLLALDTPLVDPQQQLWTNNIIVDPLFGFHQFHKQSPRQPI
jgi:hypothetical protein